MRTSTVIFTILAIVAAIMGLWVLVGVVAWVIRVLALIFLTMAVFSFRRRLTESSASHRLQ
ncbi:MAG: DUF1328 domain-containing protein [Verrucomicrobiaceae bacterium]|nr:MAG: DUF1328 domain-containing protein [Verrucomicrobiaceae bacterium]